MAQSSNILAALIIVLSLTAIVPQMFIIVLAKVIAMILGSIM
jgi:hypothetical protein